MIYTGKFVNNKEYFGSIKEAKQELNFEIVETTQTPPITYVGSGENFMNYIIYGNTQTVNQAEVSVGDYQNQQYRIPIAITHSGTVTPINIDLPYPLRKVGDQYEHIIYANQKMYRRRKNLLKPVNDVGGYPYGVTYTISNGTILLNGTADRTTSLVNTTFKGGMFNMPVCIDDGGTGVLHFCNSAAADVTISFLDWNTNQLFSVTLDSPNKIVTTYPRMYNVFWISIGIIQGAVYNNLIIEPMLCSGITTVTDFEPYIPDEELTLDVTLPDLPTFPGDNTLSFNSTVQPSQMYLKGKIII